MEKLDQKKSVGCIQGERYTKDLEDELQEDEENPFPISSMKFTDPGIKEQLRNLYTSLEQFYLISHRIKNPV